VVRAAVAAVGPRRIGGAFLGSIFLVGIPTFFETVFLLMVPLARATAASARGGYLLSLLAIVAGASMAHCLVPPCPGPLFVATALGVPIDVMIRAGIVVGACTATVGYLYACWAVRRFPDVAPPAPASPRAPAGRPLPSLAAALAPILLPIGLIAAGSAARAGHAHPGAVVAVVTEKNAALAAGALLALAIAARASTRERTLAVVREALATAGQILLVTAAGGAFGAALDQTGVGAFLGALTTRAHLPVLPLAFVVTALVRTAQGSATVAMMTSAGAFGAIGRAGALGFHPVYLALAICCGAKLVWWMNDAGFCVVSQTSGLPERQALRVLTPQGALMGVVGLLVTMAAAAALPRF
jgi:GntP family gluconate:H+ symporter